MRNRFPGPGDATCCQLALPICSIANVQTTASVDNETNPAFLEHLDVVAVVDSKGV